MSEVHSRPVRSVGTVLTRDLCPGLSQRSRTAAGHPLGVLVLSVMVTGLCGLFVHPRVFALAGGLSVVAAIGVCWPWLTLRAVRAGIRFDADRVDDGDSVTAIVSATNHLPCPAWGIVVRGGLAAADDGSVFAVRIGTIRGQSRVTAGWAYRQATRGEYPVGVPRLVTAFPFGIRESGRRVAVESRVLVRPRVYAVGPVPTSGGDETSDGSVARNRAGSSG